MKQFFHFTALALVAALIHACGSSTDATQQATATPTAVTVMTASAGSLTDPIRVSGRLGSSSEATLAFKIGGVVDQIAVRPGETFREGQLLAKLKLAEIDNLVKQAEAGAEKARRDLARAEKLYRDSVATLSQFQDAQSGYEAAAAALEVARFNQRYASIIAPFDGRLLSQFAEEGELVELGQRILSVGSASSGWIVRIGLVDRDRVRLKVGDTAEIRFDAMPEQTFTGVIAELAGAPDQMTGTYRCEVRVTTPSNQFVSGLVADLSLRPAAATNGIPLPLTALVAANGNRAELFLVHPETKNATRRSVTISLAGEADVLVTSGLTPGEQVIVDGAAYLVEGAAITITSGR